MSLFATFGRAIALSEVSKMEASGEIESIVIREMARTWREMANKPENADIAATLQKMAQNAETKIVK